MAGITNTKESFGWVSITLHWLMAIALIAMYFVGDWMVDLDYYDKWYKDAPYIHKSVGVIIGLLMLARLLWNVVQAKPRYLDVKSTMMNMLASLTHYFFYLMVFVLVVSGYLISTAKGQGVEVFGLFNVPALLADSKDRGELAGTVHEYLGLAFIILVGVHAIAALVHHYFMKDRTLKRMLGLKA
ncbi:cytochrome b [Cocleimonas sp. KMM 6892]|uniref:cytochrome b n=1 Tax=unclassified Cocleimonas TaxID=2639732 RepID=UPI002DB55F5B|nr:MULTISPECIES: cytochrome b [unclassified Cocleimonas]MEB8430740.1 cytochrome b [Cocleimonas sp. KMM 6892]MEC4714488.1 cytochrome b [Cocleimonas sp. KMM 6895]MEC4743821.1 cytochrome b [Cocleimonas sp. KMM 6896]